MAYKRVNWENLLNKMDKGIANAVEKSDLLNLIYPVGSIYMSVNNTSPATLFGGTWEQIKDRFLLACGDTYKNGKTGGEATHTLTINEMPSHNHRIKKQVDNNSGNNVSVGSGSKTLFCQLDDTVETNNTGGGQPHNNMPPYLAVYMWKRTA